MGVHGLAGVNLRHHEASARIRRGRRRSEVTILTPKALGSDCRGRMTSAVALGLSGQVLPHLAPPEIVPSLLLIGLFSLLLEIRVGA